MYNCCPQGELPDLSEHISLEINAVYSFVNEQGQTNCQAIFGIDSGMLTPEELLGPTFDPAQLFYTVHSRDQDDDAEALHDDKSLDVIKSIAAKIVQQYPHLTTLVN